MLIFSYYLRNLDSRTLKNFRYLHYLIQQDLQQQDLQQQDLWQLHFQMLDFQRLLILIELHHTWLREINWRRMINHYKR